MLFPPVDIPLGYGQVGLPTVWAMVSAYSRVMAAFMIPSRQDLDLNAWRWSWLRQLGAVPRELVWDNEGTAGSWRSKPVEGSEAFRGILGIVVHQCKPNDTEAKGFIERGNGYYDTSLLPSRELDYLTSFKGVQQR